MSNAGGTCEFNEKFTFNKKAEDTVLKVCHCSHWPCFVLRNDSLLNFKSARPYLQLTFTLTRLAQVEVKDSETASSDKRLGSRDVDLKMQVWQNFTQSTTIHSVFANCAAVVQMHIYMHARLSSKFGMFEYVKKILTRMMIWADIRSHRPSASSGKHSPDGVVLFILEYRVPHDVHSRAWTLITHILKWAPTEAPVDFDLVQDGKVCEH